MLLAHSLAQPARFGLTFGLNPRNSLQFLQFIKAVVSASFVIDFFWVHINNVKNMTPVTAVDQKSFWVSGAQT